MNQLTAVAEARTDLDLANAFARAKMVPSQYKNSPGDCFIAIQLARRFGMDPWSVMQELSIIKDRPFMSGKMAIAILNHSLAEPLRPEYSGDGDEREIVLTGRPEAEPTPLSVKLKVKAARTDNEQWKKNPDQMLMYAASRMWGRRYTPDVLLGIVFDDEEIPGVNAPLEPVKPSTPIATPAQGHPDLIDQETGEALDAPLALPKTANEKWYDWGARLVGCIRTAPDIDTVDRWLAANSDTLALCQTENEKVGGNIVNAVRQYKLDLMRLEETAQ
jgi:hypothetical protein